MPITAEQREQRRHHIGASDTPAILGISPWATPADIYWSKVGPLPDDEPTVAMQTGNRLEGPLIQFACERLGVRAKRDVSLVHPGGIFAANLDAAIVSSVDHDANAIEAKYVGPANADAWGPDGTEEIPDYVYAQVQHQAYVADLSKVYVAAFVSGYRPDWRLFAIPRDERAINVIVERGMAFWNDHVLKQVPPVGGELAPLEVLKAMRRDRSEIALPSEASELLDLYERTKAAEKEATEGGKVLQRQLITLLGDNTDGLLLDGRRITYRPQSRKSIDTATLRATFPEAAAECEKESTFPVFRVLKK
jgi:putative phage-type endonuclease